MKSVNLYWNDGLDSLLIPVSFNSSYDSIEVVLDNMEEKSYTFTVQLVDNFDHRSLSVTDFGTSYGENYQVSLMDRRIKDISLTDKGGSVEWYSAAEGLLANEVRYVKMMVRKVLSGCRRQNIRHSVRMPRRVKSLSSVLYLFRKKSQSILLYGME